MHFLFTAEDPFVETGGCLKQLDVFSPANNGKVFSQTLWSHEGSFKRPEETVALDYGINQEYSLGGD